MDQSLKIEEENVFVSKISYTKVVKVLQNVQFYEKQFENWDSK